MGARDRDLLAGQGLGDLDARASDPRAVRALEIRDAPAGRDRLEARVKPRHGVLIGVRPLAEADRAALHPAGEELGLDGDRASERRAHGRAALAERAEVREAERPFRALA